MSADAGKDAGKDADAVIEVRGLCSAFPKPGGGQTVVHQDLDLSVRRGEVLTLVGGSGAGKTVLLRTVLGLQAPVRGQVRVLGRPAAKLAGPGAAARVGMLFQQGALFSAFDALENIAFPLNETRALPRKLARAAALLKLQMVGLGVQDAHKMPAELSGGMTKRVALARALAMDPPLLVLDEPTAGLDPDASDAFCALLHALHQELGLTVLMVTHDLDTLLALSTRVAVLAERRVLIAAPVPEVLAFKHPFVEQFFLGQRGRRALNLPDPA